MKPGSLIGATIVGIAVIAAAIIFAVLNEVLQEAGDSSPAQITRLESRMDQQARKLDDLERKLEAAEDDRRRMEKSLSEMISQGIVQQRETDFIDVLPEDAVDGVKQPVSEALTEVMKTAKSRFNKGIIQPKNSFMKATLGHPRDVYSTNCQSMTNQTLKTSLETRKVANFRVTMLRPALASLERVMARLKQSDPDIYEKVGTAGAFCARLIRGSRSAVSNHSWGTAIDINIDGVLDRFADGGTQFALLILAEHFNSEGWYWGAGYGREDSMHFEAGETLVRSWVADGKI